MLRDEFGTWRTRNSVIGKATRLGLRSERAGREKAQVNGVPQGTHSVQRRTRSPHSVPPVHSGGYPSVEAQAAARERHDMDRKAARGFSYTVSLMELTEKMCKYPDPDADDPLEVRFCGLPRVPDSKWPYCEGHLELARDEKYRSKR